MPDEMTTAATLEEVLAAVSVEHQRIPMFDGGLGQRCVGCDSLRGESDGPNSPRHAEHVAVEQAAAVRAWLADRLADGGLREAVAEALSCGPIGDMTTYSETAHADHNRWSWRGDGHGDAIRTDYRDAATAALRAVTAALGVGEGEA